ncbi:CAAX amino terminal protease self- immunity [Planctomycetes bacterium Pla163]|uniref:CAAX amino terminal protease self-immunity n=1 Tax=Rohdeia mirabilis TaxID=2528008 RepID=A0A518CZF6_9BACT|nr:CAAX amino terminal protease self- immunity [Planctomycetes bacterium Pla163]
MNPSDAILPALQEGAGATQAAGSQGALSPELVTGLVLLAAALCLVPIADRALHAIRPGRNVFFARWGFAQALVSVLVAAAVGWAVSAFAAPDVAERWAIPAGLTAALVVAWHAARTLHPEGWRALGLTGPGGPRDHAAAVALLVLGAPAVLGVGLVWARVVGADPLAGTAAAALGGDPVALALVLVGLPLVFELYFRGFLLPLLAQNFSERGGIWLCALFGASVGGVGALGAQLVLGALAGQLRLRTQRVLPCVVLHALYNGAVLVAALHLDGASGAWTPL